MIQQTSRNAYKNEVLPTLGLRQQTVFEVLQKFPNMTNSEIAHYLQVPINTITPRCKELRDKDLVEQDTIRICKVTGRKVIAWRLKQEQVQLALI